MDVLQNSSYMEVDPSKRKAKAVALRTEALQLDENAAKLRDEALNLERKAAKLRIESWKMDGSISAVTNTVTIEDKYERQLAELDLMSEDYMDDPEKFEWYRAQRQMLIEMMGFQKEQEAKTNEEIKELKESLVDVQEVFNAQFVDEKGEITPAGWGVVIVSFVVPVWIGYEIISYLISIASTFKDPFEGL
eukprot:CAMPEP_0172182410 /NCGR_PEP_ID=MMETSP1050-20130122/18384_1 /TAXON_ID=233186 /ORGANISM="Cryptomonas curvata, Strain CCAP979/52" /LENGTH=190 /DNA_ID=CAMNT_0012855853 /DNA_START=231 /DNA_END=803 /DNA_ORIENTATION=-